MTTRCIDCHMLIPLPSRCDQCSVIHKRKRHASGWDGQRQRRATIERMGRTCSECGITTTEADGPTKAEVDHVRPLAAGGTSAPGNLRVVCRRCNRVKGARG